MRSIRLHTLVLLVLSALAFVSCSGNLGDEEGKFDVNVLTVKGCIYDGDAPVDDVTVKLVAYHYVDIGMEGIPIATYITHSSQSGQYSFVQTKALDTAIYKVVVVDESITRTEHYQPMERALFLSYTSPCYDSSSKAYTLEDNDFYLNK